MSTDLDAFERSATGVAVETRRVARAEAAEAIDDLVVGRAVATGFDGKGGSAGSDVPLPGSVTADPTPAELHAATTGVTPAAFAIADYGSVVLPTRTSGTELASLFVDRHVAVLDAGDVVADMDAAFERFGADLPDDYGSAILATGPSATADMGALVTGAHGPSEVRVVVLED